MEKEKDQEQKIEGTDQVSAYVSEQIKKRPVNGRKLFRRSSYIVIGAIIFGIVACITFLVIEPIVSNLLYPEETAQVSLPSQEEDEVSPDELLTEKDAEAEMTEAAKVAAKEAATEILDAKDQEESKENTTFEVFYENMYGIAKSAEPFLVKVSAITTNVDFFKEEVEKENTISGFLVAENGVELLIVADTKLITKADSYQIMFCNGVHANATLKKMDKQTGIGVYAVRKEEVGDTTLSTISYATLGNSNRSDLIGKPVVVVGSPMGDYGSISYGAISSQYTGLKMMDANYRVFQTDIYGKEQSNGVVLNTKGEIIGIVTKSVNENTDPKLLCAMAISDVRNLIENLSNASERCYLGIYGVDVTPEAYQELSVPYGAYVTRVEMSSPAMNAGIVSGDVILSIGDETVNNFREYQNAVLKQKEGTTVKVTFARYSGDKYTEMDCEVLIQEMEE